MKQVIYEVYGAKGSIDILESFKGYGAKAKAIKYAKSLNLKTSWVDKVIYDDNKDEFEYLGSIWNADEQ